MAEKFQAGHVVGVKIEGFTDHLGGQAYNRLLSEKRAESVRGWFIAGDSGLKGYMQRAVDMMHPWCSARMWRAKH
ncbi:OmpA family protein [Escherichia coli]|uniref:OmpA family protein n=1 Tax=Escherichia coli TaxID=562 RepID=UPI0030F41A2F